MAGFIKGITIEFGADVSKLNAGLKKAQGTINKTQAELKQINRALKFNPGNTTLLRQKFELLQRSVQETEAKLKQLKEMQRRMDASGVDKNSAQYRELQREIIKTESQLKEAEAELRRFGSVGKQQVLAVGNAFKTMGGKIKSAGRTITTSVSVYGLAGIYAGSKLIEMSEKQSQAELKLTSVYKKSMGASKKAAQATLDYASALQQQGVIGDEVTIAGAAVLAQYAETPKAVNNILPALDNYLAKTKGLDATQEDAESAAKMFGKAISGNYTTLEKNGIKLTENQKAMLDNANEEERAAILADIVAKKTGNMNEELAKTPSGKIQQAKNALGDMGEEIGAVLLPAVADLVSWLRDNLLPKIQQFIDFMKEHPAIAKFALALAGIVAVAGPLLMFIGSLITTIGTLVTVTGALDIALLPIIGIALAIAAAIGLLVFAGVQLYRNWDTVKAKAAEIWGNVQKAVAVVVGRIKTNFNTLKTNVTAIWNGIKSTASKVWNGIKTAITSPIQTAQKTVQNIIKKIKGFFPLNIGRLMKNIKLPHFSLSWGSKDFGKLGSIRYPKGFSVRWYKKAMDNPYLFSNSTLFGAGEAGDEVLYGRSNLMRDIANAVASSSLSGVVVNVYGSDNMSVDDLAAAVERRLITMQNRRTQAWA